MLEQIAPRNSLVLIGCTRFSATVLSFLQNQRYMKLVGVVTAPRVFEISYATAPIENIRFSDLAALATDLGVPSLTMNRSLNEPGLLEIVKSWKPDMFLVAGWYHIVPSDWLEFAPAYGLHASLLPDYRGGAPLVWAIINGEEETGITLFQLEGEVDAGPIVSQSKTVIERDETIGTLYEKIEALGLKLLSEQLPMLAKGEPRLTPQNHAAARWFPPRTPKDGVIDWSVDSSSVDRFVRAQTHPYPGAFTTLKGKELRIWTADKVASENSLGTPGTVTQLPDGYHVACGSGQLRLHSVNFEAQEYSGGALNELFGGGGAVLGS